MAKKIPTPSLRSRPGRRAQVSIEYLILLAFSLIVAGVLFGFSLWSFNESSAFATADSAVTQVANHANIVASYGEGSTVFFEVQLPNNMESFSVSQKSVTIRIETGAGISDVFAYTKPSLTPSTIAAGPGRHKLKATFSDGNVAVDIVG
ncbi:MAG: hypothetical protein NUV67_06285 [archaeon]|nr:hypothetical protein [archaeon]